MAVKKETREAAVGPVAYIGPTIKNVVRSNTVFNHGIPDKLKDFLKEKPIANELMVPLSNLAEKRKELMKENSQLAVFFNTLTKEEK